MRLTGKRRWVWGQTKGQERLYFVDDDVRFLYRDAAGKAAKQGPDETVAMFAHLDAMLDAGNLLCGIAMRFMAQTKQRPYDVGCKQCVLHGFRRADVEFLTQAQWRDECEVVEDIDFTLQVLRCGYPNVVSNLFMHDQKSQAPGGCSQYRDQALYERCLRSLRALHPDFVTLVAAADAKPQSGVPTTLRPRVQYKKALQAGGYKL
jgi:hypothetical protein